MLIFAVVLCPLVSVSLLSVLPFVSPELVYSADCTTLADLLCFARSRIALASLINLASSLNVSVNVITNPSANDNGKAAFPTLVSVLAGKVSSHCEAGLATGIQSSGDLNQCCPRILPIAKHIPLIAVDNSVSEIPFSDFFLVGFLPLASTKTTRGVVLFSSVSESRFFLGRPRRRGAVVPSFPLSPPVFPRCSS